MVVMVLLEPLVPKDQLELTESPGLQDQQVRRVTKDLQESQVQLASKVSPVQRVLKASLDLLELQDLLDPRVQLVQTVSLELQVQQVPKVSLGLRELQVPLVQWEQLVPKA